eukprot:8194433-Pyramimonas_sp.AAC.1
MRVSSASLRSAGREAEKLRTWALGCWGVDKNGAPKRGGSELTDRRAEPRVLTASELGAPAA